MPRLYVIKQSLCGGRAVGPGPNHHLFPAQPELRVQKKILFSKQATFWLPIDFPFFFFLQEASLAFKQQKQNYVNRCDVFPIDSGFV